MHGQERMARVGTDQGVGEPVDDRLVCEYAVIAQEHGFGARSGRRKNKAQGGTGALRVGEWLGQRSERMVGTAFERGGRRVALELPCARVQHAAPWDRRPWSFSHVHT